MPSALVGLALLNITYESSCTDGLKRVYFLSCFVHLKTAIEPFSETCGLKMLGRWRVPK
jgi:hypothetical protein